MTINEYYSLKKGDIVTWLDTGSKCLVMHFDSLDNRSEPKQQPNKSEHLCVVFLSDNWRVIGHRKEFGHISRNKSE